MAEIRFLVMMIVKMKSFQASISTILRQQRKDIFGNQMCLMILTPTLNFPRWDRRTKRKMTAMLILFSLTLLNGVTLLDPFKSLNLWDQRLLWRITNEKYIFLIFCSRKHCQLKLLLKQMKHIEATPNNQRVSTELSLCRSPFILF